MEKLKQKVNILSERSTKLLTASNCPADFCESDLEDIRAFESVDSGMSLFEGLQLNGLDLPHPEKLNEFQSAQKVMEVLRALEDLRIFPIGIGQMSAREFYSTLWNRTLWEGCYVRKRNPEAITLIDISHKLKRSEIEEFLGSLMKQDSVH